MPIYEQIPMRLQLSLVSNPPVNPIDANTGLNPKMWRAQALAIGLGIFDAFDAPVDLSNLVQLQLIIQKAQSDLVPLVVKTVTNSDLSWRNLITSLGWVTGIESNAIFKLDAGDTDQSLEGESQSDFWMIVQGLTSSGVTITYAGGPMTIYNASSSLPIGPSNYVSAHELTNSMGDSVITPTSQQHKEIVTINGAARTSKLIVGNAGIVDGAECEILLLMPATAGILIDIRSIISSGNQVFPALFSSDAGVSRMLARMYYKNGNWNPLETVAPAY